MDITQFAQINPPSRLLMGLGQSTPTRACCAPWRASLLVNMTRR